MKLKNIPHTISIVNKLRRQLGYLNQFGITHAKGELTFKQKKTYCVYYFNKATESYYCILEDWGKENRVYYKINLWSVNTGPLGAIELDDIEVTQVQPNQFYLLKGNN